MDVLADVKERLSIFNKLYDVIRLVNPNSNTIINNECENLSNKSRFCYDIWKKNEKCENCISKVAYERDETAIKIECCKGKISLVTATPIVISGHKYIVEMIKDVSKSGIVADVEASYEETVVDFLNAVKEKTVRDSLTGVYNKAYISERLPQDLKCSARENQSISVIMMDLDYFKDINDTYGHIIGDKVLRDFAEIVSKYIRNNDMDWIGRYGGEEFVLVLNNADESVAKNIAEKIRCKIDEMIFVYGDIKINITCSLGIYSSKGVDVDMEEAIDRADENLYKAKEQGRNRTIVE